MVRVRGPSVGFVEISTRPPITSRMSYIANVLCGNASPPCSIILCRADDEYDWLSWNDDRTFVAPSRGDACPGVFGATSRVFVYTACRGLGYSSSSKSVGEFSAGTALLPTPRAINIVISKCACVCGQGDTHEARPRTLNLLQPWTEHPDVHHSTSRFDVRAPAPNRYPCRLMHPQYQHAASHHERRYH